MNKLTISGLIFALIILAACASTGKGSNQYTLQILDAEAGAPVSGAVVNLHYFPSTPDSPNPDHPSATANSQGEVTLVSKDEMAIWQVQADGYIEQRLTSGKGALPPRYAAHGGGKYNGIVYLYKLPEPELEVLVDDSYTGPLTIQLQPAPGFGWVQVDGMNTAFAAVDPQASYIQESAGTRLFTETASAQGLVDLVVTPLLYDLKAQQLKVRDRAGLLPFRDLANNADVDRGVWGSVSEDDKQVNHQIRLFVGTREDYTKSLGSGQ